MKGSAVFVAVAAAAAVSMAAEAPWIAVGGDDVDLAGQGSATHFFLSVGGRCDDLGRKEAVRCGAWTARCREAGASPWVSICVNDTRFARLRRDLWRVPDGVGPFDSSFDFAHREVREYVLAQLRETAAQWDVDGVEVDWMRWGLVFRPNYERDDAHLLTDFMRRARAALDEIGEGRGRRIGLSVRVPRSPGVAAALGFDVATWAKEGLVDIVSGSGFRATGRDADVKAWTGALAAASPSVAFLPCVDSAAGPDAPGLAAGFCKAGAKGVRLVSAPCAGLRDFPPKGVPCGVPPLMTTFAGKPVSTVAEWEGARRPEILAKFASEMFGRRPAEAERPPRLSFSAACPDKKMLGGRAVRKRVTCTYGGRYGDRSFTFTAFIPVQDAPAPSFVLICNRNPAKNLDPERVEKSEFWPVERIVERGYAAIAFFNGDITPDYNWDFEQGVFGAFQKPWERGPESWAVLSAWAWGASRVMDWIESEPLLDASHVGVVGHSRGGKTALLAGVTDRRFAMVCSNDSGCGGAKLNHVELPESEHIDQIVDVIGCWFCGNFAKYRCREREMDFDQHMMAALVAPRLLAIASASEDAWAGQEGEFYSGLLASPAWELYGFRGLVAPGGSFPGADRPLQEGRVSYHMRTGIHNLVVYDWDRYMDFADRNGWRGGHAAN